MNSNRYGLLKTKAKFAMQEMFKKIIMQREGKSEAEATVDSIALTEKHFDEVFQALLLEEMLIEQKKKMN